MEEHFVNGLARLFRHKAHHLRPFTAHQRVDGRFKEIRNRRQERYIRQGIVVFPFGYRLSGHAELFRDLLLGHTAHTPFFRNFFTECHTREIPLCAFRLGMPFFCLQL